MSPIGTRTREPRSFLVLTYAACVNLLYERVRFSCLQKVTKMSLEKIKIDGMMISVEAVSGDSAFGKALNRLPNFLNGVKGALKEQFNTLFAQAGASGPAMNFNNRRTADIQQIDYSLLRQKPVQVPEGLKTDMLAYGTALAAACEKMPEMHAQMAEPLMRWINYNLSSPKSLQALSSTLGIQGYSAVALAKPQKAVADCFETRGQLQSTMLYGRALRRNADWHDIGDAAKRMHLSLSPGLHKSLVNTLKELEISFDTLHTRVTNDPEKYSMSQTALLDLVKHVVAVAEAYDMYAQLVYRVQEYDMCCDKIQQTVLGL